MSLDDRSTRNGIDGRALRILLYGQSLSGTGHFVRIYEIAGALAARHQVHLIDGGRPVPRPRPAHPFALVDVPRICRRNRQIVPVEPGPTIDAVMAERRRLLFAALEQIRPDVVVVEHFPFSKWGLRDEIVPLIERARAVAPGVRVLASVRDIPPGTGDDPGDATLSRLRARHARRALRRAARPHRSRPRPVPRADPVDGEDRRARGVHRIRLREARRPPDPGARLRGREHGRRPPAGAGGSNARRVATPSRGRRHRGPPSRGLPAAFRARRAPRGR